MGGKRFRMSPTLSADPVSVQALAATLTHQVSGDILMALHNTPDDRLQWRPNLPGAIGRSVFEQIAECALVNAVWTLTIRQRGLPSTPSDPDFLTSVNQINEATTKASLESVLSNITARLVEAIKGVQNRELGTIVRVDAESGGALALAQCCFYPYWHMVYHEGQINYVQLLYGDGTDRHHYVLNIPNIAEPNP